MYSYLSVSYIFFLTMLLVSLNMQLLQEEKELKDVKTAVNGLVDVFKVETRILLVHRILFSTTAILQIYLF